MMNRQAEAIEGRKTVHPGPVSQQIRHECTLELIGIRKGSTQLDFGLAKPQMVLSFMEAATFGSEVIHEVATTIKSLGNGDKKKDLDPGVLQSIYHLGGAMDNRLTSLEWIAPISSRKKVIGAVTKKVRERVANKLSGPTFKVTQVDGILDMADFSRKDRKCRIDPAIGASVIATFGPEHANSVHELLCRPVRVVGVRRIQPNTDKIDTLEIQKIEPLPSLSLGEGNFLASPSFEQLVAAQGNKPLKDARTLAGLLRDDEIEAFVAEIYDSRETA